MTKEETLEREREEYLIEQQQTIAECKEGIGLSVAWLIALTEVDPKDANASLSDFLVDLLHDIETKVAEELNEIEAARENEHIGKERRALQDGSGVKFGGSG